MSVISEADLEEVKILSDLIQCYQWIIQDKFLLNDNEEAVDLEDINKSFEATRKKRDEVSAKLGEYMLKGWALLGDSCPLQGCEGTPLVSKRGGPLLCVSCNKEFSKKSDGSISLNGIQSLICLSCCNS